MHLRSHLVCACVLAFCASCGSSTAGAGGERVRIVPAGGGYQLLRGGRPYAIHGAGGSASLEALVAAGGNSTRTWSPDATVLDAAAAQGISVTLGFWALDAQPMLEFVRAHRTHPALLMWAIGNELETRTGDPVALWKQVNDLALQVKAIDPDHPVITVVAEIGGDKLQQLDRYAPALDAVGINSYGGIGPLAGRVAASGFTRPWLVTELGPVGPWELSPSQHTAWGAPIEESSTEKAARYLAGWQAAVQGQPSCLGGYAFLWGDKLETTHTWFGMWLPGALGGAALGAVEAMTYAWTGAWPATLAPRVTAPLRLVPHGQTGDGTQRIFVASSAVDAMAQAADPGGAPLTFEWEVRPDVSQVSGADGPVAGAVLGGSGAAAELRLPATPGDYRVFVYVRGAEGHAATASAPIQVQ